MDLAPRRYPPDHVLGQLAGAAFLGSVLTLVVMFTLKLDDLSVLLSVVAAALWVATAVLLALAGSATGRPTTVLAVAAYALAFAVPAAVASETSGVVMGFTAFALGWQVVPFAWLANPFLLLSLLLRRRGAMQAALIASCVTGVLALTTPLTLGTVKITLSVGFLLWAAAPIVLAVTMARSPRQSGAPTPS